MRFSRLQIVEIIAIICVVFCFFSIIYSRKPDIQNELLQIFEFNPCYHLKEVKSEGYTVIVNFDQQIPEDFQPKLNLYFGYQTQSFDLPLIIRPGIPTILYLTNTSVALDFFLPFIQNYTGYLICVDPNNFKPSTFQIPHNVLPEVDNYLPLDMNIDHFHDEENTIKTPKKSKKSKEKYSQMICHGASFETRYCDMRNVAIYKQVFVFSTKADFIFPEPFLSLGARSPPFDRAEGRLIYEPSVIHEPITAIPGEFIHYKSRPLCYIMSRFYNSIMLWHTVFDFLVPAYHMFSKYETGNQYKNDRYVFIRDFSDDSFPELLRSMSSHRIVSLYNDSATRLFDRVIVGIEKLETNPSSARTAEEMLSIKYNFTDQTAPQLRPSVLSSLSINDTGTDPFSPLVLIVERTSTNNRVFVNIDEIEEYLLSRCDFCRVKRIDYNRKDFVSQVSITSKASVLIGVHGSGLANCIWMRKSTESEPTALIELLPDGYSCRDWFHSAANVSGVDYYSVMGMKSGIQTGDERMNFCKLHNELCSTIMCHDVLRDQNVTVKIGALSSVWLNVVAKLTRAQELYDK